MEQRKEKNPRYFLSQTQG